jgi:hypothetical protein
MSTYGATFDFAPLLGLQMQMLLWLCFSLMGRCMVINSEDVPKDEAEAWLLKPATPKQLSRSCKSCKM